MDVHFTSDIDVETEVTLESIHRQPNWQTPHVNIALFTGAIAGLLVALYVDEGRMEQFVGGSIVGVFCAAGTYAYSRITERPRIRDRVRRLRVKNPSHTVHVSISAAGAAGSYDTFTINLPWSRVSEILVRRGIVLFVGSMGEIISVPRSAFEHEAAFDEFIECARRFLNEGPSHRPCSRCGYDLFVRGEVCPECGEPVSTSRPDGLRPSAE